MTAQQMAPFDTRTVMTDEETERIFCNVNGWPRITYQCTRNALRAVLGEFARRAREQWGVTGRRVDGCAVNPSTNDPDNVGFGDHRAHHMRFHCQRATLYIHDAPKRLSAEERIEEAIKYHDKICEERHTSCHGDEYPSCGMTRILRGESDNE